MNVLLINPNNYLERLLGSGKIFTKPSLPMGILYIAAYLRSKGIHANFHDSYLHNDSIEEVVRIVAQKKPDLIGISCLTSNAPFVFHLGLALKKAFPDIPVVLGNHHASVFARFYIMQNAADYVAHGEGERTMYDLCLALQKKDNLHDIPGLSYRVGEEVRFTGRRKHIEDLNELPLPFLEDLDYTAYPQLQGKKRMMFPASSRGCVNRCKFCAVSDGHHFRARNPESVIREMKLYVEKFGVTRFGFLDPLFVANRRRVFEICDLIERELPPISWGCEGHVKFMSPELAQRMARAGCESVAFGIESGNQGVLDSIGKGTKLEQIRHAVEYVAPHIPVIGLFILGLPGETEETMEQTVRFALDLPLRQAQFSMFCPYPGTELYYQLVREGLITVDENKPAELVASWERYSSYFLFARDAPEPIYTPSGFSVDQLTRIHKRALRRFYLRPGFWVRHLLPSMLQRQGHFSTLKLSDIPQFAKSVAALLKS
jgi:magnesium-protoporphyrin IX monomethyl ester (oxidative) cyclase